MKFTGEVRSIANTIITDEEFTRALLEQFRTTLTTNAYASKAVTSEARQPGIVPLENADYKFCNIVSGV